MCSHMLCFHLNFLYPRSKINEVLHIFTRIVDIVDIIDNYIVHLQIYTTFCIYTVLFILGGPEIQYSELLYLK